MQPMGNMEVEMFSGSSFGQKVAFTVGSTYVCGFFLGLIRGVKEGYPKNFRMPRKLLLNNFINAVGKETSRYGNGFAAAGLMYYLVAGAINMFFEDELDEFQPIHKNVLCGALTGALYKSTLGITPIIIGATLGAGIIGGLTKAIQYGNQKGYIAFQMKF